MLEKVTLGDNQGGIPEEFFKMVVIIKYREKTIDVCELEVGGVLIMCLDNGSGVTTVVYESYAVICGDVVRGNDVVIFMACLYESRGCSNKCRWVRF